MKMAEMIEKKKKIWLYNFCNSFSFEYSYISVQSTYVGGFSKVSWAFYTCKVGVYFKLKMNAHILSYEKAASLKRFVSAEYSKCEFNFFF